MKNVVMNLMLIGGLFSAISAHTGHTLRKQCKTVVPGEIRPAMVVDSTHRPSTPTKTPSR